MSQKDITRVAFVAIMTFIYEKFGDKFFSILIDESHDLFAKEKMTIVLCKLNENDQIF